MKAPSLISVLIAGLGAGNWPVAIALASMFAGAYVQGRLVK
jgi:hypothetical protein